MFFKCDEPYTYGHKCKGRSLLIHYKQQDEVDDKDEEGEEETLLKLQEKKEREPEISFNAMEGTTSPTALRLLGVMTTKPVSILIDVGSTQNFVDLRIMQRTGSPILSEPAFKVIVAGGGKMCSQGVCKIQCQEAD